MTTWSSNHRTASRLWQFGVEKYAGAWDWTRKMVTRAEVKAKVFILDNLYAALPRPPFTEAKTEEIAARVYDYVCQHKRPRSSRGIDWMRDAKPDGHRGREV